MVPVAYRNCITTVLTEPTYSLERVELILQLGHCMACWLLMYIEMGWVGLTAKTDGKRYTCLINQSSGLWCLLGPRSKLVASFTNPKCSLARDDVRARDDDEEASSRILARARGTGVGMTAMSLPGFTRRITEHRCQHRWQNNSYYTFGKW